MNNAEGYKKAGAARKRNTLADRKKAFEEARIEGEELVKKKEILNLVYTGQEAADKWGISRTAVTFACKGTPNRGSISPPRFSPIEARRAGSNWLITDAGMRRVFGEPKKN